MADQRMQWMAGPAPGPVATGIKAGQRDARIDALRGFALLTIFVDHIPANALNWYTMHNFSLSDAAEIFVFLAGTSSALAYGRGFSRSGTAATMRRIGERCLKIYATQVALFTMTFVLALVRRQLGSPTPIMGRLIDAGWPGLARGLILEALPTYLDILPLYIVLLASFPLIHGLTRVSPWLALAVSGAVWLAANQSAHMNLPNMMSSDGWYFDPFAWQLLFTLGALSVPLLPRLAEPHRLRPVLRMLCAAYLVFGCLETLNWAHWGLPDLSPVDIGQPEKTLLSLYRVLSMLCVAYFVFSSEAVRNLCNHKLLRPLAMCGRHSLPVFAAGCALAYSSRFAFEVLGASWASEVGVNVAGIGLTLLFAMGLERHRLHTETHPPCSPSPLSLPSAVP